MLRVIACAVLLALVAPATAEAHGSRWDRIPDTGPFGVRVSASVRGGQLDYTIDVRDAHGRPVKGAYVRVFAQAPNGSFYDADAVPVGDLYEALLPAPGTSEWRRWTIDTGIDDGRSQTTFTYKPPAPSRHWRWDPLVVIALALTVVLFAQGFARLRRRGRHDLAPWSRAALAAAAVAIATLALCSPIDSIGERYLISVHMLQHLMLGDLVPVLLLLALRGPLCVFLLPKPTMRRVGHWHGARAFLTALLHPAISVSLWALTVFSWHLPPIYQAALTNRAVHALEHVSFAICGMLVWTQLIDPTRRLRLTTRGKLGVALGTFLAGQLLADVLIFSYSPYYSQYAAEPLRIAGLSPLAEQRLAGLAMMVEQLATFGICAALLLRRLTRTRRVVALA